MQDKFSIHKSTNAKGDVLGWAVVANRSVLIKDCATIEEACTLLDAVEKGAPENKFIKDLKAGDVVEAHGGRFFVIEDARESQAHRPQAGHIMTAHGPSDCAVARSICMDGEVSGYFWPGSTWTFQGNLKAGMVRVL